MEFERLHADNYIHTDIRPQGKEHFVRVPLTHALAAAELQQYGQPGAGRDQRKHRQPLSGLALRKLVTKGKRHSRDRPG
jgi:hypothetical protein